MMNIIINAVFYIFAVSYIGKYIFAKLDTKKGEVCNIDESGLLSEKKFNK